MSTYVFGGGPVQPSNVSYIAINLNENITLSWPISYLDTSNVVGSITDVIPTEGGLTLTLPDATIVSPGTSVMMNNTVANVGDPTFAFTLNKNDNSQLDVLAPGDIYLFYLIKTTTPAGVWQSIKLVGA